MKILIVDDERDIESLFLQKFKSELREKKIDFHFCYTAEEALAYLSTPDASDIVLILSDINMPGMNGLELLRRIKETMNRKKVVMITAYDEESNYKTAIKFGADEYFTKPIDFEKLKKALGLLP